MEFIKSIKDELQNIILRDEQIGPGSQLKKAQNFLRRYPKASITTKEQQPPGWRKVLSDAGTGKGYLCLGVRY